MEKTLKTTKEKDLKISKLRTKSKDNDKGSRSKIAKHEGTSLQRRQKERSKPRELNDKVNLTELMKECHNELTSGEIDIITNGDQATTDPGSSTGPVSAPKTSLAANARRNNEKALNILLSAI
ncbi:hypothetical protein Tco_0734242, partial [Tanacetum coccineum]